MLLSQRQILHTYLPDLKTNQTIPYFSSFLHTLYLTQIYRELLVFNLNVFSTPISLKYNIFSNSLHLNMNNDVLSNLIFLCELSKESEYFHTQPSEKHCQKEY